ncbi:nucleotidyltransferase domain-containing protein [Paenibacillus ginsengarvi]|uniref:Polymerase nucleotidyl transferase domain-containing protein n=1 Tax=Paenibacillus ginsengarvi TaxID=400777 RepID=A0A3B0B5S9_9BACL|nr:nucleotidyltransferase domain-containing protein [Paenibacillus ginsengarvi]RKN66116.1 hypothetical protein D7M11_31435 [Paenibacillus ginsengarvi]
MDPRYKTVTDYVVRRFTDHLGDRLQSVFVKGSVARGDCVWGVSDIDLVLAFDRPDQSDNALKREIEAEATRFPAGDSLVIQRIGDDRLRQMSAGTRAYWLYSCRYDTELLYGTQPDHFLPEPPKGIELAKLIAPLIHADGAVELGKDRLERRESRHLAKRMLHALALPAIAGGKLEYVPPLEVANLDFPVRLRSHMDAILTAYSQAPVITDTEPLSRAWRDCWAYIGDFGII